MKTLKTTALLCVAVLLLGGCTAAPATPTTDTDIVTIDVVKYQDVYGQSMQYQHLSDVEKACYGIIYTAVQDNLSADMKIRDEEGNRIPGIRISLSGHSLTLEQTSRLFEAFFQDTPAFFFIDRTYSLEGREIDGAQVYDTLVLRYTMDASQRATAIQKMNDAVQTILKGRPATDDDYLTELYLHDQLLTLCAYDQSATVDPTQYPNAYSAYGALVEGKAVCEGYAKAMQLLLSYVSIPATTVRGYSADKQTGHMWNLVKINGQYYHLDPTWNDSETQHYYSYFNITSQVLQRTHIIDANTLFTVDCTAENDNYFVRNNTYIDTYDRDTIADVIAAQIRAGATSIHLRFADGKYENGLLFLKNTTLTKKMVNARLPDGVELWDYALSTPADQSTLSLRKI